MVVAQAVGLLQVAWGAWAVAWVVVVGLLQVAQAAVAVGLLLQLLLQVAQVAQAAVAAAAAATPAPSSKCGALRPESLRRAFARCAPMAPVLANTI